MLHPLVDSTPRAHSRWLAPALAAAALAALCVPAAADGTKPAKPVAAKAALGKAASLQSVSKLKALIAKLEARAAAKEAHADKEKRGARRRDEDEGGLDWYRAKLYYLKQRAYPNDKVDWGAISRGATHRDQMPPASTRYQKPGGGGGGGHYQGVQGPTTNMWQYLGPRNLASPYRIYFGVPPCSGRVNAVAFTTPPGKGQDTTYGTVYAGSAGGGVWKSTNYGLNWTFLSQNWAQLQVSSIAVDPTNPNNVYVGTGDFPGFGSYSLGLMRSTDGGNTWSLLGAQQFGGTCISHVVVDPESPNIITVSTGFGNDFFGQVWRSTDQGNTWQPAFNDPNGINLWSGLAISARDKQGGRIYYAIGLGELWRSLDRGATWTSMGLPAGGSIDDVCAIGTSPTDPLAAYILSSGDTKIYKTVDGGQTWTDTTSNLPSDWGQGDYDYQVTVSTRVDSRTKKNIDVVYVGLVDLYQSPDAGATWRSIALGNTNGALMHVDQHAMAIDPRNANSAVVGSDGGVFIYTYNPTRDTWVFNAAPNKDLGITQFYHGAAHSFDATKMLGGTQDNSTPAALGDVYNWANVAAGDGGPSEVHPLSTLLQFATSYFNQIYMTQDGWKTQRAIGGGYGPTDFFAPIAIDPQDSNVLYDGTDTMFKYDVKRGTWRALGTGPNTQGGVLECLAVSPSDGRWLYSGSNQGEVYMSKDGGKTFSRIDLGSPSLPQRFVTSIAVDPDSPSRIVVTLSGTGSGHVFRCNDTTAAKPAWIDISGTGFSGLPDVPANSLAIDPAAPASMYYVGTDVGVFQTSDGGVSWSNMTTPLGLPNVQVNEVRTVYGTGYLMAATFGRGMWRIKIAEPMAPVTNLLTIPTSAKSKDTITAVITLLAPAPSGGQSVALTSSDTKLLPVPATTTVVAGYNLKQLSLTVGTVTKKTTVTLTASAGGKSRSTTVTLLP